MDLSVNFLSMVENGKRGISIEHLNELAEVLDVPTSFITFLGSTPPRNNKVAAGLMQEIQQLVRNSIGVKETESSLAHA
jgi:transcriptional regulator with XRE-family HTH domain